MLAYSYAAYNADNNGKPNPANSYLPTTFTVYNWTEVSVPGFIYPNSALSYVGFDNTLQRIALAFRGSVDIYQLADELLNSAGYQYPGLPSVYVLKYFLGCAAVLDDFVVSQISKLTKMYPNYKVWITGHSLGGALASIQAFNLVNRGIIAKPLVYTFGTTSYWKLCILYHV